MADISKIKLGDTTYNIKDAMARAGTEAITAKDNNGNIYVKTPKLEVNGPTTLNGAITSGGTITSGNESDEGIAFKIKSNTIDRDAKVIPSTIWGPKLQYFDKDDELVGFVQEYQRSNGNTGMRMLAWNEKADGKDVWNGLSVEVDKDGAASYSVSDPAAFRTAINAVETSNQSKQEAALTTLGSPSQHWALRSNVVNDNDAYNGHNTGLGVTDNNLFLYDFSGDPKTGVGKGTIWTAYTTKNKPTYSDVGAAAANHTHNYLPLSGGTLTGNVLMNAGGKGYYLYDSAKKNYPGVYDNGSNLWIGSTATKSTHHTGQTYISSGYNASNKNGNATIYISVPNASNNDGTNYPVYHAGYKPTYSDVGAAAASHTHAASDIKTGTLAIVRGGTGLVASPSMLVNLASTAADTVLKEKPRPGITGTLPITYGGTGATTAAAALKALGAAPTSHNHSAANITSGTLPINRGGTGATDAANARKNLFNENLSSTATYLMAITDSWAKGGYIKFNRSSTTSSVNSYFDKLTWNWININGLKIAFATGKTKSISLGTSVATNALWGLLKLPLPIPSGIFTAAPLGLVGSLDTVVKIQPSEHQNWTSTTAKVDIVSDSQRSAASTYYISLVLWGS